MSFKDRTSAKEKTMLERMVAFSSPLLASSRRSLLHLARRVLWTLLRARKLGPRRTLRERLGSLLCATSRSSLLSLVRNAAFAAAVGAALLGASSAAQAIELADVAAGRGGFLIEGKGRLASSAGRSVANAGDVNGDGIPDAIVGGTNTDYYPHTVPSYVVFGRADGAPIQLEEVGAGRGGFEIRGEYWWQFSGISVSGAGDVNGDRLGDLLIGAPGAPGWGRTEAGSSYVVFGKVGGEAVELSEVAAGRGGFVIRGERESDQSGQSVAGAGDVNADGLADLLIGAQDSDPGGRDRAGASYVVFGKETTEAVELSSVAAGQGGFVIRGEKEYDYSGYSISGAGDVNGDGLADLLIGAPNAIASYVVFGKVTTEAVELAAVAAGQGGFVIRGERESDQLGWSVSGAGDVNGDGLADLLIGALPDYCSPGLSYVVFGKTNPEAIELATVAAGQGGFAIRGESEDDRLGFSVSGAGDVNGDGLADLLIGAPANYSWPFRPCRSFRPGSSYVVFGKASTESVDLAAVAAGDGGFVISGVGQPSRSGFSVAGAGDVNGDGFADLLIGAPGRSGACCPPGVMSPFEAGAAYLVFGKPSGNPVELTAIAAGEGGHAILGFEREDYSELLVSELGDVNGDGIHDLLVGSRGYFSGSSFVVFGKSGTKPVDLSSIARGQGGFVIRGEPLGSRGARSGLSISKVGDMDVNGDGLADILIGAPYAEPGGKPVCGSSYVVFGKTSTDAVELAAVAAGHGGFAIRGESAHDHSGRSIAGAGDLNGDGLSDLLIGAPFAGSGSRHEAGVSYVVFGKATTEEVNLSSVSAGQAGFVILGQSAGDGVGHSVSGMGDLNGDRLADLIIGTWGANPPEAGAGYVVFGKTSTDAVELAAVAAGHGGFAIRGESASSGQSVAGAGDVNGDGTPDLLIGAPGDDPEGRTGAGATYVVFGQVTTEAVELSAVAAGQGGFEIRGESLGNRSGWSVSQANDVNGDGLADLLIGAPGADPGGREGAGRSYVVFGKATTEAVELSAVARGQGGFAIRGEGVEDRSGWSVSGGSDVNGDGIPDIAVGTKVGGYNTPNGRAYVVFGFRPGDVPRFRRGEVNGDSRVDMSDAVASLGFLFLGSKAPACFDGADANDDGRVDISDGVATLNYLFLGGPAPPDPGTTVCGEDPTTEDPLGCERPPADCW